MLMFGVAYVWKWGKVGKGETDKSGSVGNICCHQCGAANRWLGGRKLTGILMQHAGAGRAGRQDSAA